MAQAKRDENRVTTLLAVSSVDGVTPVVVYADPTTHRLLTDLSGGTGTVTSVSVTSANGFAGTVATATTTPAITISTTITGILKGNGTAISAATDGTDYLSLTTGLKLDQTSAQTISNDSPIFNTLTASELVATTAAKKLQSLAVATYPSLTEISYVKGVSSAIQTQLNAKAATLSGTINEIAYFNTASTISSLAVATYPSLTELTYVKGVTSAIQTQLGNKAPTTSPTFATSITGSYLTASEILITDGSKNIVSAAVATYPSLTELTYVKGVTSAIQTQLGNKAPLASPTFTGTVVLPTTTAGGVITLSENSAIALDPAGSADGKYTGITITGTAGYTQAFGDLVYLDPTDSRWEAVDANAASGADGDARGVIGMVVSAGTDGTGCTILLQGVIRADAKFPALTINAPVYASETAGGIVVTQPVTADVVIRVVGFALTADEIYFNPSPDYITHT